MDLLANVIDRMKTSNLKEFYSLMMDKGADKVQDDSDTEISSGSESSENEIESEGFDNDSSSCTTENDARSNSYDNDRNGNSPSYIIIVFYFFY